MSETADVAPVQVVGAGLAGCEAAFQLARASCFVELLEQKPEHRSPAHEMDGPAELVCSNSLRSTQLSNAVGLLKQELRQLGSVLMRIADEASVPAGGALAVDRLVFSQNVQRHLSAQGIVTRGQLVQRLPEAGPALVCTGPLTAGPLAEHIAQVTGAESLFFYDAIAPIIEADSIDMEVVFPASRYGKGDPEDYYNIPLDREEYYRFVEDLLQGPKVTPHDFEDKACFDGCLPIEVMAGRGPDVLCHGPMKPVGLTDPRTQKMPYAVVQLRKEDRAGSARNMVGFQTRLTVPGQKQVFRKLPGLGQARFARWGTIHRNTYVDAPKVLDEDLRLKNMSNVRLGGQIAGSEGYVEAIATGFLAAWKQIAELKQAELPPPPDTTALGGLYRHIRGEGLSAYAPSNITWAMIAPPPRARGRRQRRELAAQRALADLQAWGKAYLDPLLPESVPPA